MALGRCVSCGKERELVAGVKLVSAEHPLPVGGGSVCLPCAHRLAQETVPTRRYTVLSGEPQTTDKDVTPSTTT